jgi:hypothetical protein
MRRSIFDVVAAPITFGEAPNSAACSPAARPLLRDTISLLDVANHYEIASTSTSKTSPYAAPPAAMSNPLAEYLSAIEARDAREKAHEEYINACKYNALRKSYGVASV